MNYTQNEKIEQESDTTLVIGAAYQPLGGADVFLDQF